MAGETVTPEIVAKNPGATADLDWRSRQDVSGKLNQLQILPRKSRIEERATANNRIILAPGDARPFTLTRQNTEIIAHGAVIPCTKQVSLQNTARIVGLTFAAQDELGTTIPVAVAGATGTTVIFNSCWFLQPEAGPFVSMVSVTATSRVIFQNCFFIRGGGTVANAISNSAVAASVRVIECVRVGYTSFGAVTVVGGFP